MEQRLISKVQAFMKLIVLPLGQKALTTLAQTFETNDKVEKIQQTNEMIACNSLPMNEGYPTLLCGNIIAYLTDRLNSTIGEQHYRFQIYPVDKKEIENNNGRGESATTGTTKYYRTSY